MDKRAYCANPERRLCSVFCVESERIVLKVQGCPKGL